MKKQVLNAIFWAFLGVLLCLFIVEGAKRESGLSCQHLDEISEILKAKNLK